MTLKITLALVLIGLCWTPANSSAEIPPPPPPPDRFQENGPPRSPVDKWMKHIEKKNPEEHQRLIEMQANDPKAFHEELRSRVDKKNQHLRGRRGGKSRDSEELQTLDREFKDLMNKIRSESPENAGQHPQINDAREMMGKLFDLRQEADQKDFETLEKRLQRMRGIAERRAQNRDLIIDQHLQQAINPPDKKPDHKNPRTNEEKKDRPRANNT